MPRTHRQRLGRGELLPDRILRLPVKEWNTVKYILEDDTDEIPLIEIECGINGKPAIFYDTAIAFKSDVHKLIKTVGEGNFSIFYEDEDDEEYDPDYLAVDEIIEDDMISFFPGYLEPDYDIYAQLDELIEKEPEAQLPVINKLYHDLFTFSFLS